MSSETPTIPFPPTSVLPLPPTLSLANKSAIVTGSSRGIGRVIALTLASRGASVCLTHASTSSAVSTAALAEDIRNRYSGVRACAVQVDLADADCGPRIVRAAREELGTETIDIVVNNAAIGAPTGDWGVDANVEQCVADFERTMNVNVRGVALLTNAVLPYLPEKGGRIVNISSQVTGRVVPLMTNYAVSKAALEALTRQQASSLSKRHRITINAVSSGSIRTEASIQREATAASTLDADGVSLEEKERIRGMVEARKKVLEWATAEERLGEGEDVAEVVAWLCAEGSRWVNGQVVEASGGTVFRS